MTERDESAQRPTKLPSAPANLGPIGRRFWRNVVRKYELRLDELVLLEATCRVMDTVSRLDEAMVDAPLVVKGSMGQEREHPLLSEARQQRSALARLLAQLALPEEGTVTGSAAQQRSAWGRSMARERWQRRA